MLLTCVSSVAMATSINKQTKFWFIWTTCSKPWTSVVTCATIITQTICNLFNNTNNLSSACLLLLPGYTPCTYFPPFLSYHPVQVHNGHRNPPSSSSIPANCDLARLLYYSVTVCLCTIWHHSTRPISHWQPDHCISPRQFCSGILHSRFF